MHKGVSNRQLYKTLKPLAFVLAAFYYAQKQEVAWWYVAIMLNVDIVKIKGVYVTRFII